MINMYKECYEYAKKVGYSVNLMGEMARKYHISVDVAFGYARDYYVYMLGNSIDSWNQLINQVEDNRSEDNIQDLRQCINTFRKRLGNKTVDEYLELLDNEKYEELVERFLVFYYDPLYMHSINQYKYNDVIKFEDINEIREKLISFHKTAVEGVKQC